ncbi:MAG: hypothetical protein JWQ57_556 [Mucilaginibacter sp.]|nr:hypothetical protein [Mucilaginibacter sp.]
MIDYFYQNIKTQIGGGQKLLYSNYVIWISFDK